MSAVLTGRWVVYVSAAPQGRRAFIPAEVVGMEDDGKLRLRLWTADEGGSDWVTIAAYDRTKSPRSWHFEEEA
jgi:hypothetical protein